MDNIFPFQKSIDDKLSQLETIVEASSSASNRPYATDTGKFGQVGGLFTFIHMLQFLFIIINKFWFLESLQKLYSENSKLRYQVDFLKANIENLSKQAQGYSI